MHMETDLLDGVGNVGAGERQVIERPNKAPELSWIINRRSGSGRELGLCVNGVETGLQSTMPVRSRTSRANWR
jgi:hypothetical protein